MTRPSASPSSVSTRTNTNLSSTLHSTRCGSRHIVSQGGFPAADKVGNDQADVAADLFHRQNAGVADVRTALTEAKRLWYPIVVFRSMSASTMLGWVVQPSTVSGPGVGQEEVS